MLRILKRAAYEELYLKHDVNEEGINKHEDDSRPPVDLRAVCLVRAMVEKVRGGGLTRNWNCKQRNSAFMATRSAINAFLARDGARFGHAFWSRVVSRWSPRQG